MVHAHNFGSVLRMFLKLGTMKGVKRCKETILMVFLKKNSDLGQVDHFRPKNGVC